jgi:hypothetical protein
MGEDEGGAGDVADLAGAGGDVAEGTPATGEQREPAFAQAAQRALDGVAGTGIDIELPAASGLFDGNQDADTCTVISGVGQRGQARGGCLVESGQGVGAGGGDVAHRRPRRLPGREWAGRGRGRR